jgi:ATP-dependent RNA helicase RhlB
MSEHVLTDTFFENFDLHPLLQQGLADCGFTRCTPIQALSLPLALDGRDIAGQAQTGTGKTCAFLVAVMNRLLTGPATAERKDTDPRALVIAPTRELAIQIEKDALAIGRHTGLRCALIYGGVDYDKQRQQLRDGCDIVIATPGRLLDYYKQHVFGLDGVEVMVIDEADRMFDLGFIKDVRFIFRRLPAREERQVLLYSATLSYRVLELAYEHMHNPEKMVVESDNVTADHVRQVVYFPSKEEKMPLLLNLLEQKNPSRSIVFVNTKAAAERITDRLKRHNYRAGAISGDVPQVKRQKLLQRFKDSQLDILVATDVAARGLHIPAVSHVFNYDLPQDAEDYVHRIGRTARLGSEGDAISFACDLYAMSLPEIQDYIGQQIPVASVDPAMLVMPKPRAPDAQFLAETAADSAAYGDKIAPRPGQDAKGPRGHSRSGAPRSGERRPRPAPAPAVPAAPPVVVAEAAAPPATNGHAAVDGVPHKRRRRGGRNRRRDGDVATAGKTGEPRREPRAAKQVEATRPQPAPATPPKKPGLLRRLTSTLFGAR